MLLESLCESFCSEVGLGELERTPSKQSREDRVVLENPVELALVNSRSVNLEGTPNQQSGEDPVVLENPVELASLDRILHCMVTHPRQSFITFPTSARSLLILSRAWVSWTLKKAWLSLRLTWTCVQQ